MSVPAFTAPVVTFSDEPAPRLRLAGDSCSPDRGVALPTCLASGTGSVVTINGDDRHLHNWAQRMRAEGLAERTVVERPRIVRRAASAIGATPTQMTTEQLVDYFAYLPSAGTRQTYFSALRSWHQWLIARGLRDDDPMADLRRPRAPRRRPRAVATSHLDRLLDSGIRGRTRTAVLLCSYQGLRVHEAAKIRGEDIDLTAGTLRVVGKGAVEEYLPLHPLIQAEAPQYPSRGFWFPSHTRPGRPVRRESLSAVISRAMTRAGVPGTAHSLRHWHATELVRSGVNTRIVQTLMRHASLATTGIYIEVDRDQQRAALDLLPVPRPASIAVSPRERTA